MSSYTSNAAEKPTQEQPLNPAPEGHAPRKSAKTFFIVLAAVIVVAGVAIWRWFGSGTPAAAASQLPAVITSKPLEKELESRIEFLGQFQAVEAVELRPQVGGTLMQIHFKDGDLVQKDSLLFNIDPTPYEIKFSQASAELESASAKLELANQELERAKTLKKTDAGSTENVQQRTADAAAAKAAVDGAKAMLRDAKFDLDHCNVTAPFSGRIGTHLVSVGNLISGSRAGLSPTTLLTTLVSLDPIYLNFDMSEAEYISFQKLRSRQKGELANKVLVSSETDGVFNHKGTLDFIDNAIDRSSGTIHVRATVPNKDLTLTPGGFARVRLAFSSPIPTFLLPDASVMPDQSTHIVLVVGQDGIVKAKTVEVGDLRNGLRVVHSGLDAGDNVIIEGMGLAGPGSKVAATDGKIEFTAEPQ